MAKMGDTSGQRHPSVSSEGEADKPAVASVQWGSRSAKDWSKGKFKELLVNQKFDTAAGLCKISSLDYCEGDAYSIRGQAYSAVYEWNLRFIWKGRPRVLPLDAKIVEGTIEISNFNSTSCVSDLNIQVTVKDTGPEAEKLRAGFRSVIIPRIRGELENYVYYLLDILKAPSRPCINKPATKPNNVWLKTSQSEPTDGDGENLSQLSSNDIFQEREGAGGMRVGRDFQAKTPQLLSAADRLASQENDKALLVWSPSDRLSEEEIEKYLEISRDKYQYSGEQALGLLFWHRYDIDKALHDLANFTPHPEEWTVEDKVLFEQAFQFHGKAFDRIRQMLPDKSMSNLIRYYYKWKKFKNKTSVMDRQAKKFSQEEGDESLVTGNHNNNHNKTTVISPNTYMPKSTHHGTFQVENDEKTNDRSELHCANCGIPCNPETGLTVLTDQLCNTCHVYWKRTGEHRPLTGPLKIGENQANSLRQKKHPPKGIFINHDDLNMLASSTPQAENVALQGLERRIVVEKYQVQMKKQEIEVLKRGLQLNSLDRYKEFKSASMKNNERQQTKAKTRSIPLHSDQKNSATT